MGTYQHTGVTDTRGRKDKGEKQHGKREAGLCGEERAFCG